MVERLDSDGFSLKLGSFGKFKIHHRASIYRKIPFTGKKQLINPKRKVKFVALGKLRALEEVTRNESQRQPVTRKLGENLNRTELRVLLVGQTALAETATLLDIDDVL